MAALPEELEDALALAGERLGIFSRRILWYAEVGSTNDVAALLADRGEPEGAVIVADAQSAGRGRHGRTWASPAWRASTPASSATSQSTV